MLPIYNKKTKLASLFWKFLLSTPVRTTHRTTIARFSNGCFWYGCRLRRCHWRLYVLTVVVVVRRMLFRMVVSERMMVIMRTRVHVEVCIGYICVVVEFARVHLVGNVTVCHA